MASSAIPIISSEALLYLTLMAATSKAPAKPTSDEVV